MLCKINGLLLLLLQECTVAYQGEELALQFIFANELNNQFYSDFFVMFENLQDRYPYFI